jgi:transposase-like protein
MTAKKRKKFSLADKEKILAEASKPGASVVAVAEKWGMPAAQLYNWRLLEKKRASLGARKPTKIRVGLLPVIGPKASEVSEDLDKDRLIATLRSEILELKDAVADLTVLNRRLRKKLSE